MKLTPSSPYHWKIIPLISRLNVKGLKGKVIQKLFPLFVLSKKPLNLPIPLVVGKTLNMCVNDWTTEWTQTFFIVSEVYENRRGSRNNLERPMTRSTLTNKDTDLSMTSYLINGPSCCIFWLCPKSEKKHPKVWFVHRKYDWSQMGVKWEERKTDGWGT